jgi:hypothetical protein
MSNAHTPMSSALPQIFYGSTYDVNYFSVLDSQEIITPGSS